MYNIFNLKFFDWSFLRKPEEIAVKKPCLSFCLEAICTETDPENLSILAHVVQIGAGVWFAGHFDASLVF